MNGGITLDISPLVLGISLVGNILWFSALLGFGALAAPIMFKELEREIAGNITSAILPRYYLMGWWGGLFSLSGVIIHALWVSEGAAEWPFYLWTVPLLFATSIWWVAWKKILPKANALRTAMLVTKAEIRARPDNDKLSEEFSQAKLVFDQLHQLSTKLSKACTVLLLLQLLGLVTIYG